MARVLILLSTYNGEVYLREQMDSLYAQEGVDMHILVRDDGSKDKTINILEDYQHNQGSLTIIRGDNLGPAKSFYELARYAFMKTVQYDYYAFCDQDDVWFPNKLLRAINAMEDDRSEYKLFYGNVKPVDSNLNPTSLSSIKIANCLEANIVSNRSLGCTQVFNFALLSQIIKISNYIEKRPMEEGILPFHDAWTALVAYSLNASVIVDNTPLIYYRQHSNNVIGDGGSGFSRMRSRIKRFMSNYRYHSTSCQIVLQVFPDEISLRNKSILELCAYYRVSFKKRLKLATEKSLYHYGVIDNIGTFFVIVLGKF